MRGRAAGPHYLRWIVVHGDTGEAGHDVEHAGKRLQGELLERGAHQKARRLIDGGAEFDENGAVAEGMDAQVREGDGGG